MNEWTKFVLLAAIFTLLLIAPVHEPFVLDSLTAGLALLQEYVRLHVLTCLVPAFFLAGTIAVYVRKDAVIRLLGPRTKKFIAYPVAGLSGGILAVCSCTILPLFTGIFKRGAGIGPAIAFLFTGPAVNITAILLTGSVLGWDFAFGRLIAAFAIAVVAGLIMASIFRNDEHDSSNDFAAGIGEDLPYSNIEVITFFLMQLAVLIIFGLAVTPAVKAVLVGILLSGILGMVLFRFQKDHTLEWVRETWGLTKKILPYLFIGIFIAGMIEVVIPREFVTGLVGENTLLSNVVASTFGAFMYFATLTEVPIVQKLMALGMGKGPALTLFLTGNVLSLPSMIVLVKLLGLRKTSVYIVSVVVLSALAGLVFGGVA